MFLCAITSSKYADVITTVQSHVDVFWHEDDNGFLPIHLRLHGIANMLHQNAKARVRDVGQPWIHRMHRGDGLWDWLVDDYPSFHIQGLSPQASWVERENLRGGQNFDRVDGRDCDTGGSRAYDRSDGRDRNSDTRGYNCQGNDRRNDRAGGCLSDPPRG
jgi:hypothetical protein